MPIPQWLDLAAVIVGAVAGVLVAQDRKLDMVGFVAMALICALGGGLLRDAIMQRGGVYAIDSRWPIPLCVITGLVGFLFPRVVARFPHLYEWVDMTSVGLFVVSGTDKAIAYELYAPAVLLMGIITGVGGGMLRDVFMGEVPRVFKQSNLYALCAVSGAVCYYLCVSVLAIDRSIASAVTVVLVVALRQASLRFGILSPADVDLEEAAVDHGKQVAKAVQSKVAGHKRDD